MPELMDRMKRFLLGERRACRGQAMLCRDSFLGSESELRRRGLPARPARIIGREAVASRASVSGPFRSYSKAVPLAQIIHATPSAEG